MGLINGSNDVKANFLQTWISKYVPAIISYGSKKTVRSSLTYLDVTGQYCTHKSCGGL